ncbi:uncharacterized protein [Channa argus]|uniref:uncharacterized protein n=1 Tax=Channa argus TaxID=215402 RepID=UPI00351FFB36
MAVQWRTAVMLVFLLCTENCLAVVDQNRLANFVNGILTNYGTTGMFALAVRIPDDQNHNPEDILQEIFESDPPNDVKDTINKDEVYTGNRVVAAKVLKRVRGADHAESRVVNNLCKLINKPKGNDLLLFYVYASPCVEKCSSNTHPENILERINLIRKWKNYAVVFSKIFKPKNGKTNTDEERSQALEELGKYNVQQGSIGLENIFRCNKKKNDTQCISCSAGNQVAKACVSDDTQSGPSQIPPSISRSIQPQQARGLSRGMGSKDRRNSDSISSVPQSGADDSKVQDDVVGEDDSFSHRGLDNDNGNDVNKDVNDVGTDEGMSIPGGLDNVNDERGLNTGEHVSQSQTGPDYGNENYLNKGEDESSSKSDLNYGDENSDFESQIGSGTNRNTNGKNGKGGKGRELSRHQGQKGRRGKGRGPSRRQGQKGRRGKGRGPSRRQGQKGRRGKGRGLSRRQGQKGRRGKGRGPSRRQGQKGRRGKGRGLSRRQGQKGRRGKGRGLSRRQGQKARRGKGRGPSRRQGQKGRRGKGRGLSRRQGQKGRRGKGRGLSRRQGQKARRGKETLAECRGPVFSKGTGFSLLVWRCSVTDSSKESGGRHQKGKAQRIQGQPLEHVEEHQVYTPTRGAARPRVFVACEEDAAGSDNIPGRVLKECAQELPEELTNIFNTSLSQARTNRPQSVGKLAVSSSIIILHPHGVLSCLLYTLLTYDCSAMYPGNHTVKSADDLPLVGLTSETDESVYRRLSESEASSQEKLRWFSVQQGVHAFRRHKHVEKLRW